MKKIDLNILKEFQEVPTVILKPLKISRDKTYFAKIIQNAKDEEWVEGIYCYNEKNGISERIDKGVHSEFPYKYDVFVAYSDEDIQIYEDMNYIFFSIAVDSDEEDISKIIIYAIDIDTYEQIELFMIKYSQKEFYYMGFRMLSDKYIAIDLVNSFNDELKEYDKLFILDLYTRQMTEIHDMSIKYSLGMFQLSKNSEYIFCEEIYMDEDDEISVLTTDMYEVEEELLSKNKLDIFKNSIKCIHFDNFRNECLKANEHIEMIEVDTFIQDGILRVVGSTKDYIYYKKSKHQKYLENSKKFTERIMFGKEEIYRINKNNLTVEHLTNLELGSIFSFENDIFYKIRDGQNNIRIVSISSGKEKYVYEKTEKTEKFINFIKNKYLLISVNLLNKKYFKLIDIDTDNVELIAKDINIIGDCFFYEPIK